MWPTLLLRRGGTPDTVDAGQRGRDSYEHIGLCLPAPVGVIKGHNAKTKLLVVEYYFSPKFF